MELARIGRFLDDVASHPAALLIEGEAGIGKTTLWSAGIDQARHRGWQVLSCRPVQAEAALSFSALGDLLEPVAEAVFSGLPGPQRQALDVALLRAEPGPEPPDQRAVAVAFLGVIRTLAETAPVIVAVDDLPWLDRASAAVLEYAQRRLTTQRAGLLATVATGDPPSPAVSVRDWFPNGRLQVIMPGPLSVAAMDAVLRAKGGPRRLGPRWSRCTRRPEGTLTSRWNWRLRWARTSRRRGTRQPLPVPGTLRPLVQRRLAALSPAGREVALVAAAAAAPTVGVVLAACGDDQAARDGLDSAEEAGVLSIDDDRVRFAHPLLRSVHYSSATRRQRRRAHQRLAEVADAAEGQVRHLALAADGPDERLAARLTAAAQVACLRGAAVAGAELADLALRLTPAEQATARVQRLLDAGRLHLAAFDPDGARELLEQAIELSGPGPLRATALHHLGRVTGYLEGPPASLPLLQRALAEAGEGTALSAEIHRDIGFVLGVSTENFTQAPIDEFLAAFDTASRLGDEGLMSQLLAFQAIAEFVTGNGARHDLITGALAKRRQAARVPMELRPRLLVSHVLRCSDDLAGARALLTGEYAEAVEQGAETDLPFLILHLAELETWAGNYDLAEEYAGHGYQVALAAGGVPAAACMHAARALIRAVRGPFDEARAEAGAAINAGLRSGVYYPALLGCHALGLVELASGNPSGAHAILSMVTAATSGREMVDPGWFALRPVPGDIEALIRAGDLAAAEPLLASLEDRARRLDRASALAAAGRCRALLASAQGDHDAAGAALGQAFAAHERLDMPFELARTHLAAGDVARRARRKAAAREHVESARAAFARLGAEPWAERADEELARLSVGRAGGLALTQAERQVAGLVAAGHTNREVAAELYMGLRTVEAHLSAVYRKLGIRSRSELARAWAQQASPGG